MFYENLQAICDEKGVKITPIVEECGGKKGSIGGWKNGSWPNSKLVIDLSVRLNVSTDLLLFGPPANKNIILERSELSQEDLMLMDLFYSLPVNEQKEIIELIEFKLQRIKGEKKEVMGQRLCHTSDLQNRELA